MAVYLEKYMGRISHQAIGLQITCLREYYFMAVLVLIILISFHEILDNEANQLLPSPTIVIEVQIIHILSHGLYMHYHA